MPVLSAHLKILDSKGYIEHFKSSNDKRMKLYCIRPESKDKVLSLVANQLVKDQIDASENSSLSLFISMFTLEFLHEINRIQHKHPIPFEVISAASAKAQTNALKLYSEYRNFIDYLKERDSLISS
jgi:hypothetical protein